jgi:hypothetical protein
VLVELHGLFYADGPSEAVKTWELATMGLLELRKAMLQVVRGVTPSLRDIVRGVDAFLKVSDDPIKDCKSGDSSQFISKSTLGVRVMRAAMLLLRKEVQ